MVELVPEYREGTDDRALVLGKGMKCDFSWVFKCKTFAGEEN